MTAGDPARGAAGQYLFGRGGACRGHKRHTLLAGDVVGRRRHTRLTTLRPKSPLGRTIRTATIRMRAIVNFNSRPTYGMNVPARFSITPTAKPPSTAPPGLVRPPSTAPAKP